MNCGVQNTDACCPGDGDGDGDGDGSVASYQLTPADTQLFPLTPPGRSSNMPDTDIPI